MTNRTCLQEACVLLLPAYLFGTWLLDKRIHYRIFLVDLFALFTIIALLGMLVLLAALFLTGSPNRFKSWHSRRAPVLFVGIIFVVISWCSTSLLSKLYPDPAEVLNHVAGYSPPGQIPPSSFFYASGYDSSRSLVVELIAAEDEIDREELRYESVKYSTSVYDNCPWGFNGRGQWRTDWKSRETEEGIFYFRRIEKTKYLLIAMIY